MNIAKKIVELNWQTQYLNTILKNVSPGILFINSNGIISVYNDIAEHTLKTPAKSVLFKKFDEIFPDNLFEFSINQALKNRQTPGTVFTSNEFTKGQPSELEVETHFVTQSNLEYPTKDIEELKSLEGIIILFRDTASLRKSETVAQKRSRMNDLGEIASMVAHEIRNPLGGIKGFASLLKRDLKDRPELQKMAAFIIQGTDNLNNIVTRVLDYSRPLKIHLKMDDLVALIKDLKQHILSDPDLSSQATIIFNCKEETLTAPIDKYSIRSALLNLTLNAIQAMPGGGQVTLSLEKDKDFAVIKVSDTGIGIPPENFDKIFSPFFTTKQDGNGFGLSEVQKVIQSHEASLDVESVVNQGTTFTIKLPLIRQG